MSVAAVSLASMAVSAAGSIASSISQAGQAKRAAAVADQNAQVVEQQGQAQADLIRERALRLRGANKAAIGASGVDISGSFADALDDSDISAELDAQTAVYNSKMQANNARAQAGADRSSASSSIVGGVFGAGSQALSGYGNWKLLGAYGNGATSTGASSGGVYGNQASRGGF
jgi:hypothetical protein